MLMTSLNLNSEVIEKLQQLDKKYKQVFEILTKELYTQVNESESLCKRTTELKNLYYLVCENCQKSKSNLSNFVEEFESQLISLPELEMETRKCSELQIYAEEKKQEFEKYVIATNMSWKKQLINLTQFTQTLNGVDKERQVILVGAFEGIKSLFEGMTKSEANQQNRIKKSLEKSNEELSKMVFQSLQTKVEKFARINLGLTEMASISFEFVSYDNFVQNGGDASRKNSILSASIDLTLNNKEKKELDDLINDMFNSQLVKAKVKLSDSEIQNLFSKEEAVLEFLIRSQKILSTEKFEYQMNETKYSLINKIMKAIINR